MQKIFCKQVGSGPPLFLLHGWGMNSSLWQPLVDVLQADYSLYLADLPGHGHSAELSVDDVEQCLALIKQAAPDNAVWVAWSFGGLLAIALAAKFPELVKRLVVVASNPKFIQTDDWPAAADPQQWQDFAALLHADPQSANKQFLRLQALGAAKPLALAKQLQQLQSAGGEAAQPSLQQTLQILMDIDLRQQLSTLQCDVQWILGEGDHIVPVESAAAIQSLLPQMDMQVIEQAGHAPFVSRTDEFLRVLQL